MCDSFHTAGMSSRRPCQSMRPSARHSSSCARGTVAGLPSSGAPIRVKRRSGLCARATLAASTNSPTPLSHNSRETMVARRGPSGSGDGAKRAVSTPEPGITAMRCRSMPSPATNAASSGFWVRQVVRRPFIAQRSALRTSGRSSRASQIAGREHVTQPCQRADDRRNAGEPRRSAAVEYRLHRDRMDDVRPLGPIDAQRAQGKCAQVGNRRDSSPLHGDGQHPHSFGADRIAMGRNRAGNGDGEAGVPRRPRDRHPVGDEEAVVARDEEQFRPAFTGAGVFRFGHRGPLARPLTASNA